MVVKPYSAAVTTLLRSGQLSGSYGLSGTLNVT
jgi:hypothetical protein